MQAISEDECGLAAMSTDKDLQQLLLQLMNGRVDLLLRGRAAVLLASLVSGSVELFARVSPAFCTFSLSMPKCGRSLKFEHDALLCGITAGWHEATVWHISTELDWCRTMQRCYT